MDQQLESRVTDSETGRALVVNEAQMRLRQVRRPQHEANCRCCCREELQSYRAG